MAEQIKIELSAEQTEKYDKWKMSFKKLPYLGATGGHFGLKIIFTSLGQIVEGMAWNGKTIDLTDYEHF